MTYLLNTNVVSELRRTRGNANVQKWFHSIASEDLYLSVIVLAELRRGVERIRRRDVIQASRLEAWLTRVKAAFDGRILPITVPIAEEWGRINVPDPLPILDGLIAATARVHGLTLVTRNVSDLQRTSVSLLDPWTAG